MGGKTIITALSLIGTLAGSFGGILVSSKQLGLAGMMQMLKNGTVASGIRGKVCMFISKEAILSKCEEIWNKADETTQTGVDTINAIDAITDFIETLPTYDSDGNLTE